MNHIVAAVNRRQCKLLKDELNKNQIIDRQRRFEASGNKIHIPLKQNAEDVLKSFLVCNNMYNIKTVTFHVQNQPEGDSSEQAKTPAQHLKMQIIEVMKGKGIWQNEFDRDIPQSWEKYGDMILFDGDRYFRNAIWKQVSDLWHCICNILKVKGVALKSRIQSDGFRTPNIKLMCGHSSWVNFTDNGIKYSWDLHRSMFSSGNAIERHRIAKLKCHNEVVVDMYAGIGYFTLPYLVHCGVKLVHACEWNPHAAKALKLNLQQNGVNHKCILHEGDCREVCPTGVADRVNLGLLPSSEPGWEMACKALKVTTGGMLHIHQNVTSGCYPEDNTCGNACATCSYLVASNDSSKIHTEPFLKCGCPFYLDSSHKVIKSVTNVKMKWKRWEWKMWALHVCHILCTYFYNLYGKTLWQVSVHSIHHVKSYAPHIDHLVLDVLCIPLEYKIHDKYLCSTK